MSQAAENRQRKEYRPPVPAEHRQLILEELETILGNIHFRGSKRYPALLKYIVNAALEDRISDLKERTLGVEVFGREPGYDTNADPVVRISAGEVRKRIAQYYHESGRQSRIQIELPLGSYAPEFRLRDLGPVPVRLQPPDEPTPVSQGWVPVRGAYAKTISVALIVALIFALIVGGVVLFSISHPRQELTARKPAPLDDLWAPMLQTTKPVLFVLRTVPQNSVGSEVNPLRLIDHVHYVSMSVAVSLAHLASILDANKKAYEVREAPETTLNDIRSRPVILIGARDNDWTMRLLQPLRFHFAFFPDGNQRIEDAASPQDTGWGFNLHTPYSSLTADYAIVALFRNTTTEGPVMVVAGLGSYGTEAAAEFVQSPQYVAQIAKALGPGWKNSNFELVLKTDVIGYHAGPPVLLAATTW
jgi:hypothetical protein